MKRTYSIQENGQITLPSEWRDRLGLKKGDLIEFVETEQGLLVMPRVSVAIDALDRIAEALRAQGVSLDDLLEAVDSERQKQL
jgi:AbrB family looped-hinge helix DNA binding protein